MRTFIPWPTQNNQDDILYSGKRFIENMFVLTLSTHPWNYDALIMTDYCLSDFPPGQIR